MDSELSKEETLKLRKQYLSPSLSLHYSTYCPLKIVRGDGVFFFDENECPYLDCINNVALVGHSHPKLVEAMKKQLTQPQFDIDTGSSEFSRPTKALLDSYTSKLLATLPGSKLDAVLFVESGTQANDLALSLAEAATGHTDVIALDGAYHGHSKHLLGLSTYKSRQEKIPGSFRPNPNAIIAPVPDIFQGKYKDPATAGLLYAGEIKKIIDQLHSEGKKVASFICEAFLGCAGQIPLPEGYLKAVSEYIHEAGGLIIIDEIQTGFARCGNHFWLHQAHGVIPDIITIGKPMANGHPISAVLTTSEIVTKFAQLHGERVLEEYTTDPLSLIMASTVLNIVEEEGLQENARIVGEYLMSRLKGLMDKHQCIGDVRGEGLFIGVEIVKDKGIPDGDAAKRLVKRALLEHHVMTKEDGIEHNVIKIKPPLCFTTENAETVIHALDESCTFISSSNR